MTQDLNSRAARIEPEALWYQVMRVVQVMFVPVAEMFFRLPIGKKPEFLGVIGGRENLKTNESGSAFDQVRTIDESVTNFAFHAIGDGETA